MSDAIGSSATHAAAVEVLARLLTDRAAGNLLPLREYLRVFPGLEELVAREYVRLTELGAVASAQTTEHSPQALATAGPLAGNPERIGHYTLLRELGRGGQGRVWLARDDRLGRDVALKIVPHSPFLGEVSRRFQREARATSSLDHPGICSVYDVGSDETKAWIAMRYVPGVRLDEYIAGPANEARTLARDVALLEQLARILQAAHEVGIVHRDVKPTNVIVMPKGDPVLLDFGIARDRDSAAPLTLTGDSLGTPQYMAPEQIGGARTDARVDVWALGATGYELLSGGVRAFDAPTREGVVDAITRREPERLGRINRAVSRDLETVIATALSKDVGRRYQTAQDLAQDLRCVLENRPIRARRIGAAARLWRWARRNPAVAISTAAAFLILAVSLAGSQYLLSRTRKALAENDVLLGEVVQLADAKGAADLLAQAPTIWPTTPAKAPDMEAWLRRARSLEARLPSHRQALVAVGERLPSIAASERAQTAQVETDAWMQEQLTQIIASIEGLISIIPSMERRHALAATLATVTLDKQVEAWNAARSRVSSDARFAGWSLTPQLGLVPLGPDPRSSLEEFAHLPSGEVPQRDASNGALALKESSAIVLVLVPGGPASIGCELPSDARPLGSPLVDPNAKPTDGPPRTLRLDPYFTSKHELTRGQWRRQSDRGQATFANGAMPDLDPMDSISAELAREVFQQWGLDLPTEAQWEHAARGGTSTVWYTGDDPRSLIGHVNLSDEGSRATAPENWDFVAWLEDGSLDTAMVGKYSANPYGLHDVCGNLFEWTRSPYVPLSSQGIQDGAGETDRAYVIWTVKGGSYAKSDDFARLGFRIGIHHKHTWPDVGARPVRAVEP